MGWPVMPFSGAVIGYGNLGARHAEVISGLEQSNLIAVCDPDKNALNKAADLYPNILTFEKSSELFQSQDLDIVAVATHASKHAELALMAAKYGVHVVCEKPIAANLEEADKMVKTFKEAGLQLVIDHQWRMGPGAEKVAALLEDSAIGRLLTMKVNFCKGRPAGWELNEMGTHVFDMVCKFAGKPIDCFSNILVGERDATKEDIKRGDELLPGSYDSGWVVGTSLAASFRFSSGALLIAEGYFSGDYVNERILIEMRGTKGRLRLTGGAFNEVFIAQGVYPEGKNHNIPWEAVPISKRIIRKNMSEFAGTIAPVYEALFESIKTSSLHPCSGNGGRSAMEMISAVYMSHFSKNVVSLPLSNRKDPLALK